MDYIRLSPENLESEHICCAISNAKDPQVIAKKQWLAERLGEGLVFLKADARGKCFIEYIPAESAWAPIDAPGYMFIDCLWVSGSFKGHGYSNDLLNECIRDSREKGKSGLCIKLWVGEWGTQFSALRTVETAAGDGDSSNHVVAGYLIEQLRVVIYTVWIAYLVHPFYLALELCLCFEVADFVAAGVEVDEAVEADALLRCYEGSGWAFWLQTAAGADAHNLERA